MLESLIDFLTHKETGPEEENGKILPNYIDNKWEAKLTP